MFLSPDFEDSVSLGGLRLERQTSMLGHLNRSVFPQDRVSHHVLLSVEAGQSSVLPRPIVVPHIQYGILQKI